MSRAPHLATLRCGVAPRQRIWDTVRKAPDIAGGGFTCSDICRAAKVEVSQAREYLAGLVAAGYLGRKDPDRRGAEARYWLVRDAGIEAPRVRRDGTPVTQGLGQEQMWRTLRLLTGDTNARELAAHASTAATPVAESAAKDYLSTLHTAGYLDCTATANATGAGSVQARYRLKRAPHGHAPGPRPPMVCRTRVVFDPNLGTVVWAPTITEEDAVHA